jgi:sensor histidine kinase YesM
MLIPENQPEFVNETHVDFLAKELFTGLYLAATDLTQLYDKLKKEEVNVLEIRSRMLQLQFNPHFFFNCINSILGYMYEGDNHKADLVLVNFAQLIRQHFENNQREMVSLTDELDFLSKYVQLEQIRSSFGLEYDLYIPPDLKSQLYAYQIPTMIVQPMLEKVIWKQLAPKLATGKLWIRIAKEAECIVFTISDNGVHTPPSDSSTSDMRYMERISLYNSRFDHPITLDYFESKVDSGIANSLRMNLPFQSTKSV